MEQKFYDFLSGEMVEKYRQIIGAIAWPGKKPGFAAVFGEERKENPDTKMHNINLLAEVEEENIEKLLNWCVDVLDWNNKFYFKWYGDPTDKPKMEFVYQANKIRYEEAQQRIVILNAPYVEDPQSFDFCLNSIRKHITQKTLYLGQDSKLYAHVSVGVPKADSLSATVQDYPAVAALGYALGSFTVYGYRPPSDEPEKKYVSLDEKAGY